LLGCGVVLIFKNFNFSFFGLLDHLFWAWSFRIGARGHIAQLGFSCVWLVLEESVFFFPSPFVLRLQPFLSAGMFFSPEFEELPCIWQLNSMLPISFFLKSWRACV
jgi:hypothetical protein